MDINNTPYFLLRGPEELDQGSSRMLWDAQRSALVLAQDQDLRLPESDATAALTAWENANALVYDNFGQIARIDPVDNSRLQYNAGRGFLPLVDGELQALIADTGVFVDIAIGGDGRLAAIYSNGSEHGVLVFHLAKRWQTEVALPDRPIRVCVDTENNIWCVGESSLMMCVGEPLPHKYRPDSKRFEPVNENPHPLILKWQTSIAADDHPLAICADENHIYFLAHNNEGGQSILASSRNVHQATELQRYRVSEDLPFAIDLAVLSPGRFALLAPQTASDVDFRQRDAIIVQLHWNSEFSIGETLVIRERYPMLSQAEPRFVSSADGVLRYQSEVDADSVEAQAEYSAKPRELLPLQRPKFYTAALATLTEELDSGQPDTVWHRVYLEGCIPSGCKITLYAKVYNNPDDRTSTPFIKQPDWVWCAHRSDQAFGKGLVAPRVNESGLFEILVQRNAGHVRRMNGRYLQLRVQLEGDGRHTPAIHALKIYYPRFSYQEQYLPEHFRQEHSYDPALADQPANGADLRERLFAAFEGVLTPIETQIVSSEVLLSPEHTPDEHLPWLAELLGQDLPAQWPMHRKREWLAHTGDLQRWRGTLAGMHLALDIITDGAVSRGQVVVVENFRLRRTMATILGIDMDDEDHPLTLGTGMSGNSIVGDSLILSEKDSNDFLALFSPQLAKGAERKDVDDFFAKYGNQLTVLLHGEAKKLKSIVSETLVAQVPAHLQWRVLETEHPFVLGLSPLLAINTFIERQPPAKRVTLNDTWIGREGVLKNPVALSPKDVNRTPARL